MMTEKILQLNMLQIAEGEAEEILQEAIAVGNDTKLLPDALEQYAECWQECGNVALEQELPELQELCAIYEEAILDFRAEKIELADNEWQLFKQWHVHFKSFLAAPDKHESANNLILCLQNQAWVNPLMDDDALMLQDIFSSITVENEQLQADLKADEDKTADSDLEDKIEAVVSNEVAPAPAEEEKAVSAPITESYAVKPELVDMIRDEYASVAGKLNTTLEPISEEIVSSDSFKSSVNDGLYQLENLSKAAQTVSLLGLAQVFEFVSHNMQSRRKADFDFTVKQCLQLKQILPYIQKYLESIEDHDHCKTLVTQLQSNEWSKPLADNDAEALLELLAALYIDTNKQPEEPLQTVALAENVSLQVQENVNKELLDSLLNELPELTTNFAAVIQRIINKGSLLNLQEAQRIAHTLKGAGNTVGITGIATLTHRLEDILDILVEKHVLPNKAMSDMLIQASDCLEAMTESLLGLASPPENALAVLQEVLDWANQLVTEGIPEDGDFKAPIASEVTPQISSAEESPESSSAAMTRVSVSLVSNLLRMSGESGILSEQLKEKVSLVTDDIKFSKDLSWQLHLQISELDKLVNIQSIASHHMESVSNKEFDSLEMEQYNELHTCTSRLDEIATDIREMNIGIEKRLSTLNNLLIEHQNLQKESLDAVQHIRMIAVDSINSRCQRIVRQTCRMTDKQVELEFIGGDILIDSEILNNLVDPLMHLLRNAIDHGIETPANRTSANKDEVGKITLTFEKKGNYLSVFCQDDGSGLNYKRIAESAVKKGLVSADKELSTVEMNRLILSPGFSTRDEVTQVSGRGIGMDAIQTQVSQIKGSMRINSEIGQGLMIELSIPVSLSSIQVLLTRCGNRVVGISTHNIELVLNSGAGSIQESETGVMFHYDKQSYPVQYLSKLLNISQVQGLDINLPVLLLKDETGETKAFLIDELLGNREVMVKNMGIYMPDIPGIIGATILGDGGVAPVLDLIELLRETSEYSHLMNTLNVNMDDVASGLPVALVVDDSLSARRSLSQLLKDTGMQVNTAIDGLDAIEKIDKELPDILLVDLEMPRMNGIELAAHVRSREDISDIPIIMITSRSTEKHRKQAEAAGISTYLTKPFSEDELLRYVNAAFESTIK
ncbi:MAG: response regulator [Proteobacteria bacterium]|nr:response regulator [Pseudomonadota bacterium]